MAQFQDLMGVGVNPQLANLVDVTINSVIPSGSSFASATPIGSSPDIAVITATNNGSFLALPTLGGTNGCLAGDVFIILNTLGASITVTAPTGYNIVGTGASAVGTTGVTVATNKQNIFWAVTGSTYCWFRSN